MPTPTSKIFETGAMKLEPGRTGTLGTVNFTVVAATDIATTASDHGLETGDVIRVSSSTTLPDPLVVSTDYYVIVVDDDELKFATNYNHAINDVAIDLTDTGTGTHTITISADQSDGWGGTTGVQTLGSNDAFPWLTFSNKLTITTENDDSVTTRAFMTTPRLVGKTVDIPISYHARFKGLNRFHYWMYGFENEVVSVVAFKAGASPFTSTPAPGDEGDDVDTQTFTFLRAEVTRDDTIYIFKANDGVAPALQTGTITKSAGWVFTFTSHSGLMYEHLYELDSIGRHFRSYTTAEKLLLTLSANDKRNLQATFGKRMAEYDLRYKNAVCRNFSYKVSSAGLAAYECNLMAYTEERGDYSSSAWTLLTGLGDASLVPAHFEHKFSLGTTVSLTAGALTGLTELGMTDLSLEVETPLQSLQTTISGLSLDEPVLENKYNVKFTGTIARHSVNTYQGYRDAQTKVAAQLVSNQGWYMQELLIKEATLSEAGADDSDVAAEPLVLNIGYAEGSHQFTDWLEGITEMHDSPIVFRVRDDSSYNEMIRY